jgi:hypothetical protein
MDSLAREAQTDHGLSSMEGSWGLHGLPDMKGSEGLRGLPDMGGSEVDIESAD